MNFISPIWLFALAAVSIPVVIHLWNIRPGKTLKVGSISLVSESSRKQSRSVKLLDILLLLLRCLLLCLLAFFLAMPYYKQLTQTGKIKGWLLIPMEDYKDINKKFKPLIDSLSKAGYELHDFKSGFPRIDIKVLADTSKIRSSCVIPYWDLLRQFDAQFSSALPVYLITPGTLRNFNGDRPKVALNLHWKTYTPAGSSVEWIQSAWLTSDKNIHVVIGTSKAVATVYSNENFNPAEYKNSPFIVNAENGKPMVSLKNSDEKPVSIDTAALTMDVFADNNEVDGHYIKAVLQTVGRFSQRNLVFRQYNKSLHTKAKGNWLFWLSEKALDKSVKEQFSNVLVYQPGKAVAVSSWISAGNGYALAQGSQLIPLYKVIDSKNYNGEVIWHDGFGGPVLGREVNGNTVVYPFYSRFNPSWNDLVWNAEFPKMMLRLILNNNSTVNDLKYDRRVIDAKQILPLKIVKITDLPKAVTASKGLTHVFWILMLLIFLIERWLAFKNQYYKSAQSI